MIKVFDGDKDLTPEPKARRISYSSKSLNYLRRRGWIAESVEKWNPFGYNSKDLFGFADLLAVNKHEFVFVQVTAGYNGSARIKKILANKDAVKFMTWGHKIYVHEWKKKMQPNGRNKFSVKITLVNEIEDPAKARKSYMDGLEELKNMEQIPF